MAKERTHLALASDADEGTVREASRSTSHMLDGISTSTDPDGDWRIVDCVVQLRRWGDGDALTLPDTAFAEEVIGAAPTCSFKLDDQTCRLSKKHARLVRRGALWTIHDLDSKNGTWIDGVRRAQSALTPGTEIRVGGVVLVAESPELVALQTLLARWIGYGDERRADLDRALRASRETFSERVPLVLAGDGDLVPIAERLHRQALGQRPFVVWSRGDAASAVDRAAKGTLCIATTKLRDLALAIAAVPLQMAPRVIVCASSFERVAPLVARFPRTARIDLGDVCARPHELLRVLNDYAQDLARDLEVAMQASALLDDADLPTLARARFSSYAEIDEDVRRLIVLRALGVRGGQKFLGVAHPTLSKWAARRGLAARR